MTRETSSEFLRIDISNGKVRKAITACQSETINRTVHFLFSNNGIPLDLSNLYYAEIIVNRVDGTRTDNACIIDGDDVQYTLRQNDIAVVGENEGHIILTFEDGRVLESPVFYLNVFSTFYDPLALQSQDEYTTLTQQILLAKGYAEAAEEDAADAATAASAAEEYESGAANHAASASEYASTASSEATRASEQASTAQSAAATAASQAASEVTSTLNSYKSETADYVASASEYASTAASEANTATSNAASTSEYLASASEYASTAASEADDAYSYMTSTSEFIGSASEYAEVAGSHASDAATMSSETANYMTSTSEYASETEVNASEAAVSADDAEYWCHQAESIAAAFEGTLFPMGTVTFANLPALADVLAGWMYNVSDEFTTTSDFLEGSGKVIPAGSNVYKTSLGYWDVLAGSPVTGVKGDNEQYYRAGNVNITKANIGLSNVRNEDIGDADISGIGANVKAAIVALNNSFSSALTALKNTAVAQAVGATGSTFSSVIAKIGEILNIGSVSQTLDTTTTSYTIPEGYHDGTGTVSITTETKTQAPSTSAVDVVPTSGKVLSKVTVSAISPQRTNGEAVTLSGYDGSIDRGWVYFPYGWYPISPYRANESYVYLTQALAQAAHIHTSVYSVTSTGNQDMGAFHSYRYVNADSVWNSAVAAADGRAAPGTVNYNTGYNNGYNAGRGSINMSVALLSTTNGNQSFNVAVGDLIIETNALTSYAISGLQYLADTNSPNNQTVIWRATATTVTLYGNGSRIWRVYRY